MLFLNPALLWGTLLFLVPIIIYLIFQRKIKEMDWAAMQFLLDIMEQKRKTTIEDLLLLLLRILMILFLALAVARPLFNSGTIANMVGSESDVVLLIDNTYSMGTTQGAQTRWEKAKEYAIEVINDQASGTGICLYLASELPDPVIADFSDDYSLLEETTRTLGRSSLASNWTNSLTAARDKLKESAKGLKKLYIISDFQQNDWLEMDDNTKQIIKDINNDDNIELTLVNVGDNTSENSTALRLRLSAGAMRVGSRAMFAADIYNHGSEIIEDMPIDFMVDGDVVESSTISIAPQQAASARFPYEAVDEGLHEASVKIRGDSLQDDNRAHLPFRVVESISALGVSEGENDYGFSPTYFTELALNPFREGSDNEEAIYKFENTNISELAGEDLSQYEFICMSGVNAISSVEASILEEYVRSGGGILMFLGKDTEIPTYNQNLYRDGKGLFAWELNVDPINKASDQDSMRMSAFNFSHPLWNGLLDHQNDYLKNVKIYSTFSFKKGTEERAVPLANLLSGGEEDTGTDQNDLPIIVDFSFGRGHCVVVCTSSDLTMNDFISHPVFVGFVNQAVKYTKSFRDGDNVVPAGGSAVRFVSLQSSQANFMCTSPSGESVVIPVDSVELKLELQELREAGFYNLVNQNDSSDSALIGVNVAQREGSVLSLESDAIGALFPDTTLNVVDVNAEDENAGGLGGGGAEISSLLLLLVVLCWIGENYLAHRISKR